MDRDLVGAVSLARALVTLARTRRTGLLHVTTERSAWQVVVDEGAVTAVHGDGANSLGDTLIADGSMDLARHRRALEREPATAPVGEWLVRTGSVSAPALQYGLRRQLRERVKRMMRARVLEYRFEAMSVSALTPAITPPYTMGDLLLVGLRELYAYRDPTALLSRLPATEMHITVIGDTILSDAALYPEEQCMVALVRRGTTATRAWAGANHAPRAARLIAMLHELEAVAPRRPREHQYALLLRKLRQSRSETGPNAMLDVGPAATVAERRSAFRRLALQLHPDTLGPDAPSALVAASHEVMAALNAAAREVRRSGVAR